MPTTTVEYHPSPERSIWGTPSPLNAPSTTGTAGPRARSTDAPLEMVPVPDRQRRDWKPLAKRAGLCVVRRMFFRNSLARFASSLRALRLQPLSIFAEPLQSCVDWFRL